MGQITDLKSDIKTEIQKGISQIQMLRDEVKVRLHLAGMEVKDEWQKLEPKLDEIEKKAGEVNDATHAAIQDAVKRLAKLRNSLS